MHEVCSIERVNAIGTYDATLSFKDTEGRIPKSLGTKEKTSLGDILISHCVDPWNEGFEMSLMFLNIVVEVVNSMGRRKFLVDVSDSSVEFIRDLSLSVI